MELLGNFLKWAKLQGFVVIRHCEAWFYRAEAIHYAAKSRFLSKKFTPFFTNGAKNIKQSYKAPPLRRGLGVGRFMGNT